MRRVKLVGLLAMGALLVATTAPRASDTLPPGNGNPGVINATYAFSFNGGVADDTAARASGAGTIAFDGRGDVLAGGIINCQKGTSEYNSTITGGGYSVNLDGSGYVTISTSSAVCGEQDGVDLFLAITTGGKIIHFATDGSENFWTTGHFVPFNGVMDRD